MMLNKSDLLVVIPAFNESETIGLVVSDLIGLSFKVLVIDDASTDNTNKIASNLGAEVLFNDNNIGYEASINKGFEFALKKDFKYLITIDADNQMNACDVNHFFNLLSDQDLDLIIGKRDRKNRLIEYPLSALGKSRFNLEDPLCGLKLYNLKSIEKLLPFDTKNLAGMELAFKISDLKLTIKQVGIKIKERKGKSKYGHSIMGEIKLFYSLVKIIYYFGLKKERN